MPRRKKKGPSLPVDCDIFPSEPAIIPPEAGPTGLTFIPAPIIQPEPPPPPPTPAAPRVPPPPPMALTPSESVILQRAVIELAKRRAEALSLYVPLPTLQKFHESSIRTRLIIGSNRGGKTLSSAVEVARAVTGQDPHGKWPTENGVWFCFGSDEYHLGSVMYRKLFRAGSFKMIRDLETDEWRLFDPITDKTRARDAKPAPPLIPHRFVAHTVWLDKGAQVPKVVTLHNGWEIHFFSALGTLPQGQDIDGWWIDEEVKRKKLIEEIHARCLDRSGKGFWSCTPQSSTIQLYDLHDKAQSGDPDVVQFNARLADNPYIPQEEKDAFYRSLDDEAKRVRYFGEFALSRFTVYPEFSPEVHGWKSAEHPITMNWSRWLIVDPGRQRCGVIFAAVSPKKFDFSCVVCYDELYIENCTANEFGIQVASKSNGIVYEGGVIDLHAGKVHDMAFGKTIKDQYEKALHRTGVEFRGGGRPNFVWGCDDVSAGIEKVHEWLRVRANGKPYLYVVPEKMRWLQWELARYIYKADSDTGKPTEKPLQRNNHLCDGLRYLALLDPEWKQPEQKQGRDGGAVRALEKKRARMKARDGSSDGVVRLAAGSGTS